MKRALLSALIAVVASSPSIAEDAILWKEVNGWAVLMDKSMGNACYVTTYFEEGTLLRFGFNFLGEKAKLYFALGNKKWKSLEVGKEYPVEIQFDKNPIWTANAFAIKINEINHITISIADTDFADEFKRNHRVVAKFRGNEIAVLRLGGSAAAINELIECQKTVNSAIAKSAPPQKPKDPFQVDQEVKEANDPFDL